MFAGIQRTYTILYTYVYYNYVIVISYHIAIGRQLFCKYSHSPIQRISMQYKCVYVLISCLVLTQLILTMKPVW